jgi:hypothetical protein
VAIEARYCLTVACICPKLSASPVPTVVVPVGLLEDNVLLQLLSAAATSAMIFSLLV